MEWVRVTLSHAALCLLLFSVRSFALHALCSAHCMRFAGPGGSIGGESLKDKGYGADHGKSLRLVSICGRYGFCSGRLCFTLWG